MPFSSSRLHGEAVHFCNPSTVIVTELSGLLPTPETNTAILPVRGIARNPIPATSSAPTPSAMYFPRCVPDTAETTLVTPDRVKSGGITRVEESARAAGTPIGAVRAAFGSFERGGGVLE